MKLILVIYLVVCSLFLGGCSLVSPFKSINSCSNVAGGGANCESVESNLNYSIENDDKSKGKSKKKTLDNMSTIHSDQNVEKAELIRLLALMNVGANYSNDPILIPPSSYKVVILPYSDGKKFYSGRNIFIVAGKPRWVAGDFMMTGAKYKLNTPQNYEKPISAAPTATPDIQVTEKVTRNFSEQKTVIPKIIEKKSEKHRVNAYYLNCRDKAATDGNAIAVFEKDDVLDITDKSDHWWKVSYSNVECYVNSSYLYADIFEEWK